MSLKIIKSKDKIILQSINNNLISEIQISNDIISININSRIIYRQEFNKIELLSDYIEIFSDITKITCNESAKLESSLSSIVINSKQTDFKSSLHECYSNTNYKISSSTIFLDNA